MWLCSNKTLFTKTDDRLVLAHGLQFAGPVADNAGEGRGYLRVLSMRNSLGLVLIDLLIQ